MVWLFSRAEDGSRAVESKLIFGYIHWKFRVLFEPRLHCYVICSIECIHNLKSKARNSLSCFQRRLSICGIVLLSAEQERKKLLRKLNYHRPTMALTQSSSSVAHPKALTQPKATDDVCKSQSWCSKLPCSYFSLHLLQLALLE